MGGNDGLPVYYELPRRESDLLSEADQRAAGAALEPDTDGRVADADSSSGADGRTGWEAEREIFFSFKAQTSKAAAAAPGRSNVVGPADVGGGVASALVGLGRHLEQSQFDAALTDSATTPHHADSKTLRREKEKKIALGQKEDDHEEEQIWQQTM